MSYDYDALVNEFVKERQAAAAASGDDDEENQRREHLQAAVQALETLSSHCPMTPLLWIQYAAALRDWLQCMGADESTIKQSHQQLLALGLAEFPGSLLLQCRHVQACLDNTGIMDTDSIKEAFENAIAQVGKGSYRNSDEMVAWLYRTLADFYRHQENNLPRAYQVFVQQARVPLAHANEALADFVQNWAGPKEKVPLEILQALEQGRRLCAKVFSSADGQDEDEIEAQLHGLGILDTDHLGWAENKNGNTTIDWHKVEQPQDQRYGMGYGGTQLARAFIHYALSCTKSKKNSDQSHMEEEQFNDDNEDALHTSMEEDKHSNLVWGIYERGVAECPTVESLWLSYLKEMAQRATAEERRRRLPVLSQRACRNCPYSLALIQKDLEIMLQLADEGLLELDPEELHKRVQTALDREFLPGGPATWCDLHLQVVSVVRQRLMSILLPNYDHDDNKKADANSPKSNRNEESIEEADDLIDDLKELYQTILNKLHAKHPDYVAGRVRIMQDQALTECHLLSPLRQVMNSSESSSERIQKQAESEAAQMLAKAARLHSHPDTHLAWIHFQQYNKPIPKTPATVVESLFHIRQSFLRAWKQASAKAAGVRDFPSALAALAHEWVQWESLFGSSQSLQRARQMVQKKFQKMQADQIKQETKKGHKEPRSKRSAGEAVEQAWEEPTLKKARVETVDVPEPQNVGPAKSQEMDIQLPAKTKQGASANEEAKEAKGKTKTSVPKVTINGMEYPAHPFTVRVSNLAEDVEDMDLVDFFKSNCGAVVHARIVREKGHGKTKSKGWGLVQFEEKECVEKALAMSEEVGLHEKLVKIERSNTAAVLLVPPGMHRVRPKGEGRSSKRNERRKKHDDNSKTVVSASKDDSADTGKDASTAKDGTANLEESKQPPTRASLLSLAPRGVLKKAARPKSKIAVNAAARKANAKDS